VSGPQTPNVFVQPAGAGTVQTTLVPLLVPPLSASRKDVPGGIGRSTVALPGTAIGPGGHSAVCWPCSAEQGWPKFGPPLHTPDGLERQKLGSGRGSGSSCGWHSSGCASSVPHGAPSFWAFAQKKPLVELPVQLGGVGAAVPQ